METIRNKTSACFNGSILAIWPVVAAAFCLILIPRSAIAADEVIAEPAENAAQIASEYAAVVDSGLSTSESGKDKSTESPAKTAGQSEQIAAAAVESTAADESVAVAESSTSPSDAVKENPIESQSKTAVWIEDYTQGMKLAKDQKKLMLIHFFSASDQQRSEATTAGDSVVNIEQAFDQRGVREKLDDYVMVKLPIDAQITVKGKTIRLLDHGAFSELHKRAGLAVIDLAHENTEYFGYVVSMLPFTPGKYYRFNPKQLETLVNLPEGTLTQRSMIFAVRIHPEHPASTNGEENPVLLSEATDHSNYQAQVHVQGHQGWGSRFERILGKLLGRGEPGTPVEVVAESWPDQDLMDSCVDCVASWRQSEGHWNAVKAQQASYGYDIREGTNGIWYATGIFRETK
jgi:hypothetical protein